MRVAFAKVCQSVFFLVLLTSESSLAQFSGKIFTTPEERAYLDALRDDFLNRSQDQGFDIDEAGPPPLPETDDEPVATTSSIEYTLGGILTRSDGSHTVWLNNQPVAEADLPASMSLASAGPLAVLRIETVAGNFLLKPGQTLNASTGEIQEAYQRVTLPVENETVPGAANDAEAARPPSQLSSDAAETTSSSAARETATEADAREEP